MTGSMLVKNDKKIVSEELKDGLIISEYKLVSKLLITVPFILYQIVSII